MNSKLSALTLAGFIGLSMMVLTMGCGFLSNADPCDRTQAMRNGLEKATGRDCDLITTDDLADVRSLSLQSPYGEEVNLKKRDFAGLGKLQLVILRTNELPAGIFDAFDEVPSLDLSGNNLSQLHPDLFTGMGSLVALNLSGNNLSQLHPDLFTGMGSLVALNLSGNSLSQLHPDLFTDLDDLQTLNLGSNILNALPPGIFDGLDSLEALILDGNPGDPFAINIGECNRNPTVRVAMERGARLNCARIDSTALSTIRHLSLGFTGLTELRPDEFSGMDNLQELRLQGNYLDTLASGAFADLDNLRLLYLGGNDLTELPPDMFTNLENLETLTLQGNPGDPFRITHPNANLKGMGWYR